MKVLPTLGILIPFFLGTEVFASNVPSLGPFYPVIEPDLLRLLKTHAKEEMSENTSRINLHKELLKSWSKNPQGQLLPEASKVTRHRFESKTEVQNVLKEDFRRDWLFIDAKHHNHIVLAKAFMKEKPLGRVILVSGSINKTQKALNSRVWFDQGGTLIKRLKIEFLPAVVEITSTGITVTQAPSEKLLRSPSEID